MKKLLLILICLLFLCSCQKKIDDLPSNPLVFKSGEFNESENDGYRSIEYNDKIYIMFGSIKPKGLFRNNSYAFGKCLGFVDKDKNDRIYELLGESQDEWLIEYYINGEMEEPIILREVSKKNCEIPYSVESFGYDYWNIKD